MHTLYLDLETYSEVPISAGTHAYAEQAEILLLAWALDDGPVSVWDAASGDKPGRELQQLLRDGDVRICAHNSHFDRTILRRCVPEWAADAAHWDDTMAQALMHGLPGSLGQLCEVLRVPTDKAKDKEGKRLIQLFCKPQPKGRKIRRATRETHSKDWARFVEYAALDIEAMREVHKFMPSWNYRRELPLWQLDQRINDRGVCIDLELVRAAIAAVDAAQTELAERTQVLTEGAVQAATQRDAMLTHLLEAYDIQLPDMQGSTLEKLLDSDLPGEVLELLRIRLQACTTSTSKYKTLLRATSSDGRLRNTLQFCGASRTGRWAGRLFQPQNLPRPSMSAEDVEEGIRALKSGAADLLYDNVMSLTSNAIRGCIVAPPGRKLVVADLSAIEGRTLAWLAGEQWKLDAYRAGQDMYKLTYARSFGVPVESVTKEQRQIGKVQDLFLGYQGGVGAFVTGAATYGIDLEAMAERIWHTLPDELTENAAATLEWVRKQGRPTFGLSDRAWKACDALKQGWRGDNPKTTSLWTNLQYAVTEVLSGSDPQHVSGSNLCRLTVAKQGAWLVIRLPSGRFLSYPGAALQDKGVISYMGVNQYSRKWGRLTTYGGKLAENITQAVARDILASSMPAIEAAGYQIVLTVHDEIISEAPDTADYTDAALSALMSTPPEWATGLPLAAAGFEAYRYRKD